METRKKEDLARLHDLHILHFGLFDERLTMVECRKFLEIHDKIPSHAQG